MPNEFFLYPLQTQVRSTKFADYLTNKVLPHYQNLDSNVQTKVLQLLADVCMFTGPVQEPLKALECIYDILMVSHFSVKCENYKIFLSLEKKFVKTPLSIISYKLG